MNNNASHLSTPLPCPPWCVLPAGHGFESLTDEGLLRDRRASGPLMTAWCAALDLNPLDVSQSHAVPPAKAAS